MRCNFLRVASASVISVELLRLFRIFLLRRSFLPRAFVRVSTSRFDSIRLDGFTIDFDDGAPVRIADHSRSTWQLHVCARFGKTLDLYSVELSCQ